MVDEGALAACVFDMAVTGDAGVVGSSQATQVAGRFREGSLLPWRAIAAGLVDAPEEGMADDDIAAGGALPGTLPEVLVAPELRGRTVRGTDVYVFSNFVCLTGVHAGVFDMESGGVAALELIERFDHPDVEVEDRNEVSAGVWARIEAGYRFVAAEELGDG